MKPHWFDGLSSRIPGFRSLYWQNSAFLKKTWCLALEQAGRLRPSAFVIWLATRQCNFHCPFCEASAGQAGIDELSTGEAKGLIDDLSTMQVRRLLISGGEPLLRQDLPHLLEYAAARDIEPGLISNGFLVAERWHALKAIPYCLFMTSLDGLARSHDRLRRSGSYAAVMGALQLFASVETPVRMVKTVVHTGNLGELSELAKQIEASGATDWNLTPIMSVGRAAVDDRFAIAGAELRALLDFVHAHRKIGRVSVELGESHSYLETLVGRRPARPFFCGAGLTRCTVMPNGDVLPCSQAYETAPPMGNVRQRPLSQIWRHEFAVFRQARRPAACEGCEHWGACQGGCWAEQLIRGGCLEDLLQGNQADVGSRPDPL
jgi:radical SAM protein with 4Fe4S-binding SPASM domain